MSNKIPEFSDPKLQEVANKVGGRIFDFQKNLDNITSNIKTVEKWLQDSGFCFNFDYPMTVRYDNLPDHATWDAIRNTGVKDKITESLFWGKDGQSGKWRLLHQITRQVEFDDYENTDIQDTSILKPAVIEQKPLVETSTQVRLQSSKILPKFLDAISAQSVDEEEINIEDIPF